MGSQVAIVVMLAGIVVLAAGACIETVPQQADSQPAATAASGLVSPPATTLRLIPTPSSPAQASASQPEETYSVPASSPAETQPGSTNSIPAPALNANLTEMPEPMASVATSEPSPNPTDTPRPAKAPEASRTPSQALAPTDGTKPAEAATATPGLVRGPTASSPPAREKAIMTSAKPVPTPVQSVALLGNEVDDLAFAFTLPSAAGIDVSLDSFLGEKDVVLVFYRAFW